MAWERSVLLAGILVTAGLAGCISAGEEVTPTNATNTSEEAPESGDASEPSNTSETTASPNRTSSEEEEDNQARESSTNETTSEEPESNETTAPEPADPGWPNASEAPIRPGIGLGSPLPVDVPANEGGFCTANFLFRGPLNRTLYLGTAGHCVEENETVGLTEDESFTAKTVFSANNESVDFALLELEASYRDEVHPKVLYWGGPTSVDVKAELGDRIHVYGSTALRGGYDETSRLEGVVTQQCDGRIWARLPGYISGDSGSPVIHVDGEGLGILVGGSVNTACTPPVANDARIVPLDLALTHAERGLGVDLELVTWTFEDPDRAPQP